MGEETEDTKVLVRAKHKGYYGVQVQPKGSEFLIDRPEDFSQRWMERIDEVEEEVEEESSDGSPKKRVRRRRR